MFRIQLFSNGGDGLSFVGCTKTEMHTLFVGALENRPGYFGSVLVTKLQT